MLINSRLSLIMLSKLERQKNKKIQYKRKNILILESANIFTQRKILYSSENKQRLRTSAKADKVVCVAMINLKIRRALSIGKHLLENFYLAFSDFCGLSVCALCLTKTKPYPCRNENNKNRGTICKVCDRKFFIRDMLKDTQN